MEEVSEKEDPCGPIVKTKKEGSVFGIFRLQGKDVVKHKGFKHPNTAELRQQLEQSGGPKQKQLPKGKPRVGIQEGICSDVKKQMSNKV